MSSYMDLALGPCRCNHISLTIHGNSAMPYSKYYLSRLKNSIVYHVKLRLSLKVCQASQTKTETETSCDMLCAQRKCFSTSRVLFLYDASAPNFHIFFGRYITSSFSFGRHLPSSLISYFGRTPTLFNAILPLNNKKIWHATETFQVHLTL